MGNRSPPLAFFFSFLPFFILEEEALLSHGLLSDRKLPTARLSPKTWFMKKLLIYLSVIGVSLAILPIHAEAGSWHKKKDRFWARHHVIPRANTIGTIARTIIGDITITMGT